jgi:hypothetical protein
MRFGDRNPAFRNQKGNVVMKKLFCWAVFLALASAVTPIHAKDRAGAKSSVKPTYESCHAKAVTKGFGHGPAAQNYINDCMAGK